jgi:hypothetical protein
VNDALGRVGVLSRRLKDVGLQRFAAGVRQR